MSYAAVGVFTDCLQTVMRCLMLLWVCLQIAYRLWWDVLCCCGCVYRLLTYCDEMSYAAVGVFTDCLQTVMRCLMLLWMCLQIAYRLWWDVLCCCGCVYRLLTDCDEMSYAAVGVFTDSVQTVMRCLMLLWVCLQIAYRLWWDVSCCCGCVCR